MFIEKCLWLYPNVGNSSVGCRRMLDIQRCNLVLLWLQFENIPFEILLCNANQREMHPIRIPQSIVKCNVVSSEFDRVFSIQSLALCAVAPQ